VQRTRELAELFALGGIKDAEVHDEVELQTIRWHKIAINASMNPSAVLSGGLGNAAMSLEPEIREHILGCMYEVFDAVPKILGKPFPESLAKPELILKSTERNTKGRPSMLVDWEQGRPMELEVILGNPVRIAREKGVELPRLQSAYALLRSAQKERFKKKEEKEKASI
jgi:2-dehydropantoate 2-reductase